MSKPKDLSKNTGNGGKNISPYLRQFIREMKQVDQLDEEEFVSCLLKEEKTEAMARARLDFTIEFLQLAKDRLPKE